VSCFSAAASGASGASGAVSPPFFSPHEAKKQDADAIAVMENRRKVVIGFIVVGVFGLIIALVR